MSYLKIFANFLNVHKAYPFKPSFSFLCEGFFSSVVFLHFAIPMHFLSMIFPFQLSFLSSLHSRYEEAISKLKLALKTESKIPSLAAKARRQLCHCHLKVRSVKVLFSLFINRTVFARILFKKIKHNRELFSKDQASR